MGRASIQEHLEQRVTAVEPVPRPESASIRPAGRTGISSFVAFCSPPIWPRSSPRSCFSGALRPRQRAHPGLLGARVAAVLDPALQGLRPLRPRREAREPLDRRRPAVDLPRASLGTLGTVALLPATGRPRSLNVTEGMVFFGIALGDGVRSRALRPARSAGSSSRRERVLFVGGGPVARVARAASSATTRSTSSSRSATSTPARVAGRSTVDARLPRDARVRSTAICRRAGVERVLILSPEVDQDELADLIRAPAQPRRPHRDPAARRRRARALGRGRRRRGHHRARHQSAGADPLVARCSSGRWTCLIAVGLLVLLLAVLLFVAHRAQATSRGPVFFVQERIGRGRPTLQDAQVPHHGRRMRTSAGRSSGIRARTRSGSCSSTTRASRASAASCATRASTSCRSSGTCSAAT